MWARIVFVMLVAAHAPAVAADPLVCTGETGCVGIDDEGRVCTPVGCFGSPVEGGEVHQCVQAGCAHVEDDEGDDEPDYAVVAVAPGVEQADCHAHAWFQEARGFVDCTVVDEPDEFEYTVASVVVAWNATGHANETRFHEVAVEAGVYETEDGGAGFEEVAVLSVRAHDHDGDGVPEDVEASHPP